MDGALIHTIIVLVFNLFWLYDRKWDGFKEIYGFRDEPYNNTQKNLITIIWIYALSGIFTLLIFLFKTL